MVGKKTAMALYYALLLKKVYSKTTQPGKAVICQYHHHLQPAAFCSLLMFIVCSGTGA
jgi:hypothetical protein